MISRSLEKAVIQEGDECNAQRRLKKNVPYMCLYEKLMEIIGDSPDKYNEFVNKILDEGLLEQLSSGISAKEAEDVIKKAAENYIGSLSLRREFLSRVFAAQVNKDSETQQPKDRLIPTRLYEKIMEEVSNDPDKYSDFFNRMLDEGFLERLNSGISANEAKELILQAVNSYIQSPSVKGDFLVKVFGELEDQVLVLDYNDASNKNTEEISEIPKKLGEVEENKSQLEIRDKIISEMEVTWEWQSNADAWSSEPIQWTKYSDENNCRLEKAYSEHQKEVDVGEYIVFIQEKDMFQQKKDDAFKQRRVRRITKQIEEEKEEEEEEEEEKSDVQGNFRKYRFFGDVPKTYNSEFGSLEDFLSFFEKRGSEIEKFTEAFKEVESHQDIKRLNQDIVPIIIESIKKESIRVRAKRKNTKILLKLFEVTFTSFKDFYGEVLKAYTLDTFLYKNMNKYLRDENWIQLDYILPYTFCLFKAFLSSDLASAHKGNLHMNNEENGIVTLYRGASLDEISLSHYDPKQVSTFSWNGVTSTTTKRDVADFFYADYKDQKKLPILFMIEIPMDVNLPQDFKLMHMKPFSVVPEEEEVALAPGSVFELISVHNHNDTDHPVEIKLRLISNLDKLVNKGKVMHGAMQAGLSTNKVSRIISLKGKELAEAISHLKGNGLLEELELTHCKYDTNILTLLTEILATLPKLTKLTLFSGTSNNMAHLSTILKALKNLNIQSLQISDQSLREPKQATLIAQELKHLASLKTLDLNLEGSQTINDEELEAICSQGLKHLASLTTLRLNLTLCSQLSGEGLESLWCNGIKHLTSLETLDLNLAWVSDMTELEVEHLCSEGLQKLNSLAMLTLNFSGTQVDDEGMKILSSAGLRYLTSLTSLNLSFEQCSGISDNSLLFLSSYGLKYLDSLTFLSLNFAKCECITDDGLHNLESEGIKHLVSLKALFLNFLDCSELSSESYEGLKARAQRMKIFFILNEVEQTEDEEGGSNFKRKLPNDAKDENLIGPESTDSNSSNLIVLGSGDKLLDLYIKLTDDGQVKTLKKLAVDFSSLLDQVSNEELSNLFSQQIRYLTALTTLSVSFEDCETTDEEFDTYFFKEIKHLNLIILELNLKNCKNITDKGLKILGSQGLKHLGTLKDLNINFLGCDEISDEGLSALCSEGIACLTELKSLNLNFEYCSKISDDGLHAIFSEGIKNLSSISSLTLNFKTCLTFTDRAFQNLCNQEFKCLASLKSFSISFLGAWQISNNGLLSLYLEGLKYMTSLTNLSLTFERCQTITEKGLNNLCSQGIRFMSSLTSVNLNFDGCEKISREGYRELKKFLQYFGYQPDKLK